MYYLIEFYPVVARNVNGKPPTEKIILKGSVPELATVLRLLHDAGIIENKNKEEVCRLAAACFSTHFTNDLSAGSLKNHFDAPTPETLQETKNNLHLMITVVNNRLTAILGALFLAISWY